MTYITADRGLLLCCGRQQCHAETLLGDSAGRSRHKLNHLWTRVRRSPHRSSLLCDTVGVLDILERYGCDNFKFKHMPYTIYGHFKRLHKGLLSKYFIIHIWMFSIPIALTFIKCMSCMYLNNFYVNVSDWNRIRFLRGRSFLFIPLIFYSRYG